MVKSMMYHLVSFQTCPDVYVCDSQDSFVKYCYIITKIKMGAGVTYRRTLSQLVSCHELNVQVFALRLPSGLD